MAEPISTVTSLMACVAMLIGADIEGMPLPTVKYDDRAYIAQQMTVNTLRPRAYHKAGIIVLPYGAGDSLLGHELSHYIDWVLQLPVNEAKAQWVERKVNAWCTI